MNNIDVLLEPVRALLIQIGAFMPRLAIDHLDISGGMIQQAFLIILAGIVFAGALAFGLGARDHAAALLKSLVSPRS